MPLIREWPEFVRAIGPHLMSDDPLRSLEAAGFQLEGEPLAALRTHDRLPRLGQGLMRALRGTFGQIPTTLSVGPAAQEPSPVATTGYAAIATMDLAILNEVLAELYRVGTFPHELTEELSALIVDIDTLRTLCTGVPDDATGIVCRFGSPAVASASSTTQLNVHSRLSCVLEIVSATRPSLIGVVNTEIPLLIEVVNDKIQPNVGIPTVLQTTFDVSPASTVQPRSASDGEALSEAFRIAAGRALLYLRDALAINAAIPIHKKRFPNSMIDATQIGAAIIRQSGRDFAIIGLNVERTRDVSPISLIGQLTPEMPFNLRTVVDEQFASDVLSSIVESGDLAAFINRVISRNSPISGPAPGTTFKQVTVEGASIRLLVDRVRLSVDCLVENVCFFNKDLRFTATINGTIAVYKGNLAIDSSSVDFNVDNTDAVACTVLSGYIGPVGTAIYGAGLAFLASYNPSSSDLDIPISETSSPLPGSDRVLDVELLRAKMDPGVLVADGKIQLISDPLRVYAYLRVVNTFFPGMRAPVPGAIVELFELDKPPPDGDDVVDPSSYSVTSTPLMETTKHVVYTPRTDELLGTATTDERGRVTFVVVANRIGGSARTTERRENLRTGLITQRTVQELVGEGRPDIAVTVRSADGELLIERRLISLNDEDRRVGTFDQPVEIGVRIEPQLDRA